ncbi:MAG: hypothetical protein V4504_01495 [Patescibacteria group bacterium]
MDQIQLQEKITECFIKLPKEAQEVFSSMKWMETLKMIIKKYSLTQEQENIIGTETTLVLLGIIHVDEYKNILKNEISLSEETKEKIIQEINDTILKPIQNELIDTFKKNDSETNEAIDLIDWKQAILDIKTKYNFNLEQLEELERETKLIFSGSTNPENFKKEIQEKMRLSGEEASQITNEMNEKVFKKIRDEFAKIMALQNTKNQNTTKEIIQNKQDTDVLKQAGIEVLSEKTQNENSENISDRDRSDMLQKVEHPELIEKIPTLTLQKLSGAFNLPEAKTEYSIENITKDTEKKNISNIVPVKKDVPKTGEGLPKIDPYRMPIE